MWAKLSVADIAVKVRTGSFKEAAVAEAFVTRYSRKILPLSLDYHIQLAKLFNFFLIPYLPRFRFALILGDVSFRSGWIHALARRT